MLRLWLVMRPCMANAAYLHFTNASRTPAAHAVAVGHASPMLKLCPCAGQPRLHALDKYLKDNHAELQEVERSTIQHPADLNTQRCCRLCWC